MVLHDCGDAERSGEKDWKSKLNRRKPFDLFTTTTNFSSDCKALSRLNTGLEFCESTDVGFLFYWYWPLYSAPLR